MVFQAETQVKKISIELGPWDLRQSLSNWSPSATERFDLKDDLVTSVDLESGLMISSTDLRLLLRLLLLFSAPSSTSDILLLSAVVFLTTLEGGRGSNYISKQWFSLKRILR